MEQVSKKHRQIKKYKLITGEVKYKFTVYLGVDPETGSDKSVTRSSFNTAKEAELAIDKLKYEFKQGKKPENSRKTFQEVYLEWDKVYKESGIKMSTYSKTEGYFKNHILPYFGDKKVSKITVRHCEEFGLNLKKSLKYFHHIINYAKDVLDTAARYDYIHVNPFDKIKKYPKEGKHIKVDNYLETYELKRLLDYASNENWESYTLLRLLALTGIRKGEMRILTWSDLDFKKKLLKIYGTYSYSKHNHGNNISSTKTDIDREILLDDMTLKVLKKWKKEQLLRLQMLGLKPKQDKDQLIFSNTKNKIVKDNYANNIFSNYLEILNIRHFGVHGLRHTHATHLLEANPHSEGIRTDGEKQRLGHSNKQDTTSEYYRHVTNKVMEYTLKRYIEYLNSEDIY